MNQERKELAFVLIMLSVIFGSIVIFQWLLVTDLCSPSTTVLLQFSRLLRKAMMLRFIYVILITSLAFLYPIQQKKDESLKWVYTFTTLILAAALILGFSHILSWYNLFIFPMVFIGFTIMVVLSAGFFLKRHVSSDESIFGISREKSAFYFEFKTKDGCLCVHKPQQNIFINGGPGSGKSESWIKGIIYQCAMRNYAGFIYDWEGDPTKKGSPILSKIAYGSTEYSFL